MTAARTPHLHLEMTQKGRWNKIYYTLDKKKNKSDHKMLSTVYNNKEAKTEKRKESRV